MITSDILRTLTNEELNTLFIQIKNECAERKIKEASEAKKIIWTKITEIKDLLKKYDLEIYNSDHDIVYLEDMYSIERAFE